MPSLGQTKKLEVGKLNDRITIQKRTEEPDGSGGVSQTAWETFRECWADIQVLSTSEKYFLGQTGQELSHKVIIRHQTDDTGLNRNCRIKWIPVTDLIRYLDVMSFTINHDYKFSITTLFCMERVE